MGIVIAILSVLLLGAVAFIFWLVRVLKNTFSITESLVDLAQTKTGRKPQAYNDKYYPATVIAQVIFDAGYEGKVVDWSRYEDNKIVGFFIMTTDKAEDYYGKDFIEVLEEEDLEELLKPVIIRNAQVYEYKEGDWMWKSA